MLGKSNTNVNCATTFICGAGACNTAWWKRSDFVGLEMHTGPAERVDFSLDFYAHR